MNRRTTPRRESGILHAAGWLASGSMIAVALFAPATAAAATDWATVTGHVAFSSDANHEGYWGDNCSKDEQVSGSTYTLTHDYDLVVVKTGSGEFANTLFANAKSGQTVWADTDGDSSNGPDEGDKDSISHIIFCGPSDEETSTPTATATDEEPTATPTDQEPTATPTDEEQPTATPTDQEPTATPTDEEQPTATPTDQEPTATPTDDEEPTATATETPTATPTDTPSTEVEGITGTPPAVTPPPTDTLASTTAPSNDGWRLALVGLAGVIGLALIIPRPKRATAKRR